jgi:type IV pilus assembly protein PilV
MLRRRVIAGFALVESMVTIVVIAFGLLGVAGLVSRSFVTETEANQRTEAQLLLMDMTTRIEANRANAVNYVTGDNGITGYVADANGNPVLQSCDAAALLVDRDRCEWGQMIAGADERIDARNPSMLVGAIGCIYEIDAFNRVYAVSVAWQGPSASTEPAGDPNFAPSGCGRNLYGDEAQRRLVTTLLRIGTLNPAAGAGGGGAGGAGGAGSGTGG